MTSSCPATFGTLTVPNNAIVRTSSPPMNRNTSIWFRLNSKPDTQTTLVSLSYIISNNRNQLFHMLQTQIYYSPTNWTTSQQIRFPMYRNVTASLGQWSNMSSYLVRFTARVSFGSGTCFASNAVVANSATVTLVSNDTVISGCVWTPNSPGCWYMDP